MAVNERRKIEIRSILEEFVNNRDVCEYEFPVDLTQTERAIIHKQCQQMGLWSKSRGGAHSRYLTVYKKRKWNKIGDSNTSGIPELRLVNPDISKEIDEFAAWSRHYGMNSADVLLYHQPFQTFFQNTRLLPNDPAIPPWPNIPDPRIVQSKINLPIVQCRNEFIQKLLSTQVLLILGETGSGKSTQVPQFILEHATASFTPCRVVVAEPRRIAAISLAERVANERGERVGYVVGYQIRLECRQSTHTLLTYCTNGVLLKAAISEPTFFQTITHLIIDEIHERDKYSDFLLILLRDILPSHPNLKVIIMSASLERELLSNYFSVYQFLDVPGRSYSVEKYFLEDVLYILNYPHELLKKRRYQGRPSHLTLASPNKSSEAGHDVAGASGSNTVGVNYLDGLLDNLWSDGPLRGDTQSWLLIFHQFSAVGGVNYQHSVSRATLLMIMAGLGELEAVDFLLQNGADPSLTSSNGWQAMHWATAFGNDECSLRLDPVTNNQSVVDVYHSLVDDDQVDVDIILELLVFICERFPRGAVLVFLPGYEDILQTKEGIERHGQLPRYHPLIVVLHSQVHGQEQRRAFEPAPDGRRKIVLATNIAEVSITLEDVCYVIDTGKMKQTVYDTVNDVSALSMMWISKTNVVQRTGRAGRCRDGVCFCLYSELRFGSMRDKAIPEILRAPIHELCLQTKLLKPDLPSVAEFLMKAPEPPSVALLKNSVRLLKTIGAFDMDERLTILGRCLTDLSIDPQMGKMVLYGTMLRCMDPVLTIAAVLSYREPFILPRERTQADTASQRRYELCQRTPFSDHGVLLNAFLGWEYARKNRQERQFLWKHFLSNMAMEKVIGVKGLLIRSLQSLGFGMNFPSHEEFIRYYNTNANWPVVKAALTAGVYPNIAFVDQLTRKLLTETESAYLNSASVLLYRRDGNRVTKEPLARALTYLPTEWVVYNEMCRQKSLIQVHTATAISSMTVALFAGPADVSMENISRDRLVNTERECWDTVDDGIEISDVSILHLDDWLKVRMENDLANQVVFIRGKLHSYFIRQLMDPSRFLSSEEEKVLEITVRLLDDAELDINPTYQPFPLLPWVSSF